MNDSPMALRAMQRVLSQRYEIAWLARDGREAVRKSAEDTPDLVLMDLMMPVMNGVEATRQIMCTSPCAILVVTASVGQSAVEVFQALGNGALDAVKTPALGIGGDGGKSLLKKLDTLERLISHCGRRTARIRPSSSPRARGPLITLGASAGGPAALAKLTAQLPIDLSAPVVVVQHIDPAFAEGLVRWLGEHSTLPVEPVRPGHPPSPGKVALPVRPKHLVLDDAGSLQYCDEPKELTFRPSIDVFFESVARTWSGPVAAALLTGLGRDGARGLLALREAGHLTVAQDRATSSVYGMPRAAGELNAARQILALEKIPPTLTDYVTSRGNNQPPR